VSKLTTLNLGAPPKIDTSRQQMHWDELRSVFPIYLALAKHLQIEIPFPQNQRVLPEKAEVQLHNQVQTWLDAMDLKVQVHQLRHLLQMTTLNASESGLRALIMRHLRKSSKNNTDRDKIDFLLVQYFALCAPPKIYHKQIELNDVAHVMKPVLGETDCSPLSWCEPLEKMIVTLRSFRSLRDMLKTSFIEQGRRVKEGAGGMFYDPSSLLAFIRFNFLVRRTLIELMHADLIAIRAGLTHLDTAGIRTVSCVAYGLSATEPIGNIRQIADDWKQPFQKEYNERSVNQVFEKLLALRSDVEKAVKHVITDPSRRDAIVFNISVWEAGQKEKDKKVSDAREELFKILRRKDAQHHELEPIVARLDRTLLEMDESFLNLRFRVKEQVTSAEWAEIVARANR